MRVGTELKDRYRLTVLLGRGGMGQVWRAEDLQLERTVAVKMILSHLIEDHHVRDEALARFRREGKAVARLNHPNIPVIYDLGVHHEPTDNEKVEPFLVMEHLQGRDLHQLLMEHPGGLPIGQAMNYLAQVADALTTAHSAGVVHRDIKPSNLMLVDGRVRVLDFGIASFQDATGSWVTTGKGLGSPAYMPYEQIIGRTTDPRSDLYALGATLYNMLIGASAFRSTNLQYLARIDALPDPPSVHRPDVPRELDALVLKLLAKDPRQRPARATEVRDELRALADTVRRQQEATRVDRQAAQRLPAHGHRAVFAEQTEREREEILATARREAAEMRAQAQRILEEGKARRAQEDAEFEIRLAARREEADRQAEQTRREADSHAKQLIAGAHTDADRIIAEAEAQAEGLLSDTRAEADRVRTKARREVNELTRQRDSIHTHLRELREVMSGAAAKRDGKPSQK